MTIKEQWEDYKQNVLPRDVGAAQLSETRNAFYAGAVTMLKLQLQDADRNQTDEEACAQLEAWHEELREFGAGAWAVADAIEGKLPS